MKKNWVLSQEALDALLIWLDPDRQRAGEKYETIRGRLIKIFICNRCAQPEELTDETINRVVSKVHEISPNWDGDPALYFYKVARFIILEWRRETMRHAAVPVEEVRSMPVSQSNTNNDRHQECFDRCLNKLQESQRTLLVEYYKDQGRLKIDHHKKMAARMGIAVNALRIQVHRIRRTLKTCVLACVEGQPH